MSMEREDGGGDSERWLLERARTTGRGVVAGAMQCLGVGCICIARPTLKFVCLSGDEVRRAGDAGADMEIKRCLLRTRAHLWPFSSLLRGMAGSNVDLILLGWRAGWAGSVGVWIRVVRVAPNRAAAPRDSRFGQNKRLGDSAIRRFGNS